MKLSDWKPLEILARIYQNKIDLNDYMFMGIYDNFGTDIYLYKNIETRAYLNVDYFGECYKYVSYTFGEELGKPFTVDEYEIIHKEVAVNKAINYK